MMPFSHALLSQYAGASRETVTHYRNRFRTQGHADYSRDSILLCRDALTTFLGSGSTAMDAASN